jgi:tetratricopeptide (TPR) repeat protein
MRFFSWMRQGLTIRASAALLSRRALAKSKKFDHRGAIEDYTSAIDLPGIPSELKAALLYNRALEHTAVGDPSRAIADLNTVLAMNGTLASIKKAAQARLTRLERRGDRKLSEILVCGSRC